MPGSSDFGISRVIHGNKTHTTVSTPPGTLAYFGEPMFEHAKPPASVGLHLTLGRAVQHHMCI